MKCILPSILFAMMLSTANAAVVAIIDSGVDYKHEALMNNMWVNPNEIPDNMRDEDGNGYQDDVYGWNFGGSNNQVINYKYLGTFSQDPYTYFEIQARMFRGETTDADRAWVKAKREDPNFMTEMGKFGNFVHGTHVAGIASKNTPAKVIAVKLIPTETNEPKEKLPIGMVKPLLATLAKQQMKMMAEIGYYIAGHKAEVANGSFGTGFSAARGIVEKLMKKATDAEKDEATKYFLDTMVAEGQKFVGASPNTLFVFAAGNDGENNDVKPTSPANVKADNVITVAASFDRTKIASFSNYGIANVEVAAPGVIIHSCVPGNEYLNVSGTSQAAPYVANIAGRVKDANPKLKPVEIKAIIMGTVDKKEWLKDKVMTSGIVNPERAVEAAELSARMSVSDAIAEARASVADIASAKTVAAPGFDESLFVLPLMSTIY